MSGFDIPEVDGYNLTALKYKLNESKVGDNIRIIKGTIKSEIPLGLYEVVDESEANVFMTKNYY